MGITNGGQLNELFLAGGLGFLLGALYDVFRVIRLMMKPSAKWVFVQDLLFFIISAVVTFLFALGINGGELRLYLFLGLIVGFVAYLCTLGRVVVRCARGVITGIVFVWHWFWYMVFWPFRMLFKWLGKLLNRPFRALGRFFRKISGILGGKLKKISVFFRNPLHLPGHVLYNQNNKED